MNNVGGMKPLQTPSNAVLHVGNTEMMDELKNLAKDKKEYKLSVPENMMDLTSKQSIGRYNIILQ